MIFKRKNSEKTMKSECPICFHEYEINDMRFCFACFNLCCVHCLANIVKTGNKSCSLCRTLIPIVSIKEKLIDFLLLIDDETKSKEVRAISFCIVIHSYKVTKTKIDRKKAIVNLIKKAYLIFDNDLPNYLFIALIEYDIVEATKIKEKHKKFQAVFYDYQLAVKDNERFYEKMIRLRKTFQYASVLTQLKDRAYAKDKRAIEMIIEMRMNREGDTLGNCKKFYDEHYANMMLLKQSTTV